ncbi:acyl-CoA thioesterase [Campylobacter sp. RM16192]|uniref:acyl-CoA thioesterase n=1 Tax=Campylobacter sp. RM16192 TaxID=1660080 RepID=UPI0014515F62|nr:thioesterase family protein [Campylobacter sp. RM16192]QCD53393.1 thioesterase [Campylobacter sp. RM16192]
MRIFSYKFKVGKEAIDINNHANNAYYLVWMQEAAFAHSNFVGDTFEEQLKNNSTWVIKRNEIDYLEQIYLGDEIEIKTWTKQARKVSSNRFYEFIKDGKIIAKAITTYVYFDLDKKRPKAIPGHLAELYGENEEI